jgi:hypothetical protein
VGMRLLMILTTTVLRDGLYASKEILQISQSRACVTSRQSAHSLDVFERDTFLVEMVEVPFIPTYYGPARPLAKTYTVLLVVMVLIVKE